MSFEREQLFGGLARIVRREPVAVPALTVAYAGGTGLLEAACADGALVLAGQAGAPSASVPLEGLTLGALRNALTLLDGVTATLTDAATEAVRAEVLLADAPRPVGPAGITFSRFTSPNWRLLEPVRAAIEAAVRRLDAGVAQLNLLTAGGPFADLWGQLTGTPRRLDEADADYTARQLREVLRHRENNAALADLLEHEVPSIRVVEVRDLRRDVFVCSGSALRGRRLAGERYNADVAEVDVTGFPNVVLLELARAHVAAGVTVFVRGTFTLGDGACDYRLATSPLRIGTPPPMQIGGTAIGVGQIGP